MWFVHGCWNRRKHHLWAGSWAVWLSVLLDHVGRGGAQGVIHSPRLNHPTTQKQKRISSEK